MNAPAEAKQFPLVQLATVLEPIEKATGLGNEFYTDDQYYKHERDTLLGQDWVCIGFADDLKQNSFAKPVEFMGLPLLMIRNRDGVLQVFHNVCSHRGMKLVQEAGEIQGVIRCGYHSWTYDLNGALKGTPHIGGVNQHKDPRFACEKHGLKALRSHVWMGMVFVNLSGTAPDFEEAIKPLTDRWQQFLGPDGLSLISMPQDSGSWSLEVKCNWKLAVENYCEAYHLPWVHPSLNTYSRLEDHYNIAFADRFAGQGSHAYNLADVEGTSLPTFPAWPADRMRTAEYVALFPNVLLGIQADHAFAMVLQPLSANRTVEHLRLFFVGQEAAQDPNYAASRHAVLAAWRVVFSEDIGAVEGMQAGRQSPGFKGGAFSPEMDAPTHYFHQWMARKLLDNGQA
ncbi:aromatic ring-hydroxylating oxygenase subunit alpha [Cupriavidus taiwanensis]|uniref:aromatic ring-hydroxylating oxygenase subunit alpha n=1 Tax=Cupriavidus taiwanensis TaxID=164546 RepID=UPI00041CEC49|nr:aromatic ring-hydroxylating dioxygenase subunit alpha [Cupriavidus taiwanensis]SOY44495.1 Rieske 2Fe-2S family protein [Cupriavidus taiwanensis]SOZ05338.1 Rieske 2Fe-2S family protein [Cupriavidus taiwanensis]